MKTRISGLFFLFAFLVTCAAPSVAFAQKIVGNSKEIQPFTVGEVLTYEGKFSKIIRGISVADLSFSVENAPDGKNYLIRCEARSKGTLSKLFRFNFLQNIQSTVDGERFNILKTVKHDVQRERVRDSEAVFDYSSKQVTYTEIDPKNAMRPPRKVASQIEADHTQDMITGIYMLRRLPLEVGKTFELSVSDSGLIYKVPVRVTRREQQKTILGKIWCFRLEPEVFGDQRLIEQEGSMTIWITDDTRRIPVRTQINADIGRVEVKLKSVSYLPKTTTATK